MLENFLVKGVFKCSKENNGQSFFKNLNSPSVGKCQAPEGLTLPSKQDTSIQPRGIRGDLGSSVRKWRRGGGGMGGSFWKWGVHFGRGGCL